MRALEINPQEFDIRLSATHDADSGFADVSVRMGGDVSGNVPLTAKEAERVGAWFTGLAAEIRKAERQAKAAEKREKSA